MRKNCIYFNVNANNGKEHRMVQMKKEEKIDFYFKKALHLFQLGKKTSLNFQLGDKRWHGRNITHLSVANGKLKFKYNDVEKVVSISEISDVRRLRTKKFLFTISGLKQEKKAKTETIKKDEKPVKKVKRNKEK